MTNKELALKILEKKDEAIVKVTDLKKSVEGVLDWASLSLKEISGGLPETEEDFLDILRILADEALTWDNLGIPAKQIAEIADGPVIGRGLKLIDKYCLDRWFGEDWYIKLKEKIG